MDGDPGKRVCIIGAGIAGLVTAKVLEEDGFEIVTFEKQAELGGLGCIANLSGAARKQFPRELRVF
jgi:dimethylaniline monooxygenase (N-oxide forming)